MQWYLNSFFNKVFRLKSDSSHSPWTMCYVVYVNYSKFTTYLKACQFHVIILEKWLYGYMRSVIRMYQQFFFHLNAFWYLLFLLFFFPECVFFRKFKYLKIVCILLYKFVKFGVNKRFWHYNFLFSRSLRVWKMRIEWQFCTRDEVEGVNLSRDSQFFEQDDSVKTQIYSGKILRQANLSNEYNRMLFKIFTVGNFPKNWLLGPCFPENSFKDIVNGMKNNGL